ncbi:hypothetical protein K3G63_22485 [Hymenobacter sp. HSC-4F20]|uniref:hypothetical protein n=1 Tax=Hymenobacter sp. HSC-4F20 TaxID=2864135 RepID=UPI001C72DB78|nr:hypothetical protein [Hymenobacter sp. HSC-4F20]MBX0293229.1 hypothetical protein [Hymenobacter sp. HSC-4F20]
MKNIIAILLLALSLCSCNSSSETKGVEAILAFYGGTAKYSKGVIKTTEEELQGRFYEIELSGVAAKLHQHFTSLQLPASNCAYLFYHALTPEEKKEYAFVRIIIPETNRQARYDFPTADLASVERAMSLATHSIRDLQRADYAAFLAKGNAQSAPKQEWLAAIPTFVQVDKQYGRIKEFSLQGFASQDHNASSGVKHLVRLAGVLVREKQSTDFSLVVEPTAAAQSDFLYGFVFAKEQEQ